MELSKVKQTEMHMRSADTALSGQNNFSPKIDGGQQGNAENATPQQPLAQSLLESVKRVESLFQLQSKKFEFSVHEESKKSYVVVTDSETNEIIRQIPSEEVLALAEKIDKLQEEFFGTSLGLLFDKEI